MDALKKHPQCEKVYMCLVFRKIRIFNIQDPSPIGLGLVFTRKTTTTTTTPTPTTTRRRTRPSTLNVSSPCSSERGTCQEHMQRNACDTCGPYVLYVLKFSVCLNFLAVSNTPGNMTAYFIDFKLTLNVYKTYL